MNDYTGPIISFSPTFFSISGFELSHEIPNHSIQAPLHTHNLNSTVNVVVVKEIVLCQN